MFLLAQNAFIKNAFQSFVESVCSTVRATPLLIVHQIPHPYLGFSLVLVFILMVVNRTPMDVWFVMRE
jgi:F0F1-type ATP synthase membrane subunit a